MPPHLDGMRHKVMFNVENQSAYTRTAGPKFTYSLLPQRKVTLLFCSNQPSLSPQTGLHLAEDRALVSCKPDSELPESNGYVFT